MAVKFKSTININDQYTFPTTVGTDGQYLSITNAAAGQLDWTDAASGAVATTIQKNVFTGNGSQTTFTLQSPITSETQTQVYIDGVYQSKDNYSVSGSSVIFLTSPDSGTSIEIIHIVSVSAVINRETFTGDGVEVDFTLSSEVSSENNTQIYIDGVYQSKDNYTTSGQIITFSTAPDDGVEIEVVHIKTTETTQINSNQLVGDGSTTNFTLSQSVDSKDKSFVFIQGVYQEKSTYTLSGTTLSFTTAPQVGYTIEVVTFSALSVANDTLFLNNFTGNGSTVNFDLSSVPASENAVDVYINGVYQEKSTFAISGSVLTFITAPPSGYSVEVKSTGGLKNVVSGSIANYDAFVVTTNTQAQKNRVYVLDADLTLTLPLSPSNGDSIKISNLSAAANCVIARNGENIMGVAEDLTLDNPNFNFELIYTGAAKGWVII